MENIKHVWALWEMILVLVVLIPLAFIPNILGRFKANKIEKDEAYWETVRKVRHAQLNEKDK